MQVKLPVVSKHPEWFTDQLWQLPLSKVMMHTWAAAGKRAEGIRGAVILPHTPVNEWKASKHKDAKTGSHLPSKSSAVVNGKGLLIPVWFDIGWQYIREMLKTQDKEKCWILLSSCTYWKLNMSSLLFQQQPNRISVILENSRHWLMLLKLIDFKTQCKPVTLKFTKFFRTLSRTLLLNRYATYAPLREKKQVNILYHI